MRQPLASVPEQDISHGSTNVLPFRMKMKKPGLHPRVTGDHREA
jgi:hypothetical protein